MGKEGEIKIPCVDRIKGLAGRDGEKRRDDYATEGVWLWCSAQQQYFALNNLQLYGNCILFLNGTLLGTFASFNILNS